MENSNVGQFVVKENTQEQRNPRFISWIAATNKKVGDTWSFSEYTSWINKHLKNFKKIHKLEESQPVNFLKNGQVRFTRYLEQVGA